ncbi:hypothetical protein AB205_0045520 [Aquarana catesbeiana]|uniref:Uncharacterized protein n=1 Tax=Aquarana catesbeiana TaxID=8400 RepID=A0A2G9RRK3_AQUCT|nr:hypothetical protein AB205_0045520 [Aquarana catesbeiana]
MPSHVCECQSCTMPHGMCSSATAGGPKFGDLWCKPRAVLYMCRIFFLTLGSPSTPRPSPVWASEATVNYFLDSMHAGYPACTCQSRACTVRSEQYCRLGFHSNGCVGVPPPLCYGNLLPPGFDDTHLPGDIVKPEMTCRAEATKKEVKKAVIK